MKNVFEVNDRYDENRYYSKVFGKLACALGLTALVSYFLYTMIVSGFLPSGFLSPMSCLVLGIVQIGITIYMSFKIGSMSTKTADLCLVIYSMITGINLSFIPLAYNLDAIFGAAIGAAILLAVLWFFGRYTKTDLSRFSTILFAGLISVLIMSIVGIFWSNPLFNSIYNYLGLLIFAGYVAYDVQNIRRFYHGTSNLDLLNKFATLGALELYLDIINIFLRLLRIFANNDD